MVIYILSPQVEPFVKRMAEIILADPRKIDDLADTVMEYQLAGRVVSPMFWRTLRLATRKSVKSSLLRIVAERIETELDAFIVVLIKEYYG
ncbi:MAG: hypothetical protein ACUVTD_08145 [Nitrososphaerales archaeon]